MNDKNVHQGGCDLTWKIEKSTFFKNVYKSPSFYLCQSQKAEFYLELSYQDSNYFCYLKSSKTLVKTTLYFDVCIYRKEESGKKSGIQTFSDEAHLQLAYLSLQEKTPFGSLLVHVHLKDISDPSCSLHRLFFRTVEEIESRKVDYEIPFYQVWASNLDLVIRVPPVFPNSIPFEMKIGGEYDKEEDTDKILQIDISEFSKLERFGFFCKVTCEDAVGKSIGSATGFHSFDKKSSNVCSLKISFEKDTLESFYSPKYVLSLKCEFSTTEGKSISLLEKSVILPDPNEGIGNESSEKEKDSLMDDFLGFYLDGKYADIVISTHGRTFLAHKTVLSAQSPVFAAMFDVDMVEKESNMVEIVDTKAETLDEMLFFMYSKTLRAEEYESILKLYEAADKYQVLALKDKCLMVLKRHLNTQNAIELLIMADMHNDAELQNSVESVIFTNAEIVFKSEEWIALIENEPGLGCKVMHHFCMANM